MAWDFSKLFEKSQQDHAPHVGHVHDAPGEISIEERKRRRALGKRQRAARKTMRRWRK